MQTVTIEGKELPVPEGCPDFRITGGGLHFSGALMRKSEWHELYNYEKRHAACVAYAWFMGQAMLYDPDRPMSWSSEKHHELRKAADAWLELVRWE